MDPDTLRHRRATAQLLHRPDGADPVAITHRLLAVQAQDPRAARLALRARGTGFTAAAVDRALTQDRSLVVTWLCRGTLHLVRAEDLGWLHATVTRPPVTSHRRLDRLGVPARDVERAPRIIAAALERDGPLTRAELGERLAAAGIATEGQRLPHLLALPAAAGTTILGPVTTGGQAFVLTRDWLGSAAPAQAPDRAAALGELARRYLAGHAPAAAADLAAWAGVGLRDARAGLARIAAELEQDGELVWLAGAREPAPQPIPPRLLPAFDPYLLGWRDRSFAVMERHARAIHPGGGILRAAATAGGEVRGTWRLQGAAATVEPFDGADWAPWAGEIADVERYLTGTA